MLPGFYLGTSFFFAGRGNGKGEVHSRKERGTSAITCASIKSATLWNYFSIIWGDLTMLVGG